MWGYTPDKIVKLVVLFSSSTSEMTEAERQRQEHIDRGDFGPPPIRNPGTWDTYDPSQFYDPAVHYWQLPVDWDDSSDFLFPDDKPPSHGLEQHERDMPDYPDYEMDRPDQYDYYWSEPEAIAPEKWEDWARALAV